MALLRLSLSSSPPVQYHRSTETLTPKPLISTLQFSCFSLTPNDSHRCIQTTRCNNTSDFPPVESNESSSSSTSSVFIKGLAHSTTEGRLRKVFSEFGEVRQVKIILDKKTKQSLGYGYVWFASEEQAGVAMEEMNGKVYFG